MKQIEVQIMGQSYLLGTTDNGDQKLLAAVEKVDAAMCKIRDSGKIKARDRIAVLAALNLAFELADRTAPPATLPSIMRGLATAALVTLLGSSGSVCRYVRWIATASPPAAVIAATTASAASRLAV